MQVTVGDNQVARSKWVSEGPVGSRARLMRGMKISLPIGSTIPFCGKFDPGCELKNIHGGYDKDYEFMGG